MNPFDICTESLKCPESGDPTNRANEMQYLPHWMIRRQTNFDINTYVLPRPTFTARIIKMIENATARNAPLKE